MIRLTGYPGDRPIFIDPKEIAAVIHCPAVDYPDTGESHPDRTKITWGEKSLWFEIVTEPVEYVIRKVTEARKAAENRPPEPVAETPKKARAK